MKTTKTATKNDRINNAVARMLHSVACGFARHEAFAHVASQMGLDPVEVFEVTKRLPN